MKERASDIHIEPEEKEVIVRYRIDGELYIARRAPRAFMNSIVSRIKIESSLNIAEKRLPQDGRITKKIAGKGFDIRVSTIPTSRGYERIVMRLLNKSSVLLDLPDLGLQPARLRADGRAHPAPRRHHPRHRAHRLRQDDDALRVHQPDQPAEPQHPHRRGSGRVRDPGHPPGPRAAEDRAHVRERAPRLPPPGPGRRHGRRDPRQGDASRSRSTRRSPVTSCSRRSTRTTPPAPSRAWSTWASSRSSSARASSASSRSASSASSARTASTRTRRRTSSSRSSASPPERAARARSRAATTRRRATSRATVARARRPRGVRHRASARCSTRRRAATSARTPASAAGAASTSCCSSTTPSARSSCKNADAQAIKRAAMEQGMDSSATTARARCSPA